jgi:hypothetical protein
MFYAPSGNNEFIELYNRSETRSIDLFRFKIKYYTSKPDTIISAGYGTLLPPQSYAVIFEGDYDLASGMYKNIVPPSALILRISDNAFGSNGMANTANRPLWLINAADDTLDYYTYSANNNSGYSDEKKNMSKDTSSVNWGNSTRHNGTPGFKNSLVPKLYDLQISSFKSTPFVISGEKVEMTFKIKNIGTNMSSPYTIKIFNDINKDSIPQPGGLILSQAASSIQSKDSVEILLNTDKYNIGWNYFIAFIETTPDEDMSNNIAYTNFNAGVSNSITRDLIINEIMYDPAVGEPEWIELKNISSQTINLKNWSLSDLLTTPTKAAITNQDYFLAPNEFTIAARDTLFCLLHPELSSKTKIVKYGILGNTEDGIIIYNYRDEIIDSVIYNSSWGHKKGYSLERISPDKSSNDSSNWTLSLCSEKSTPGKENSVVDIPDGKRNDLVINEIMYDPAAGNNEFVEFLNIKKDVLNIGGWSIEDQHKNKYKLSDSNFVIPPGSYFLLVSDSSVIRNYDLFNFNYKMVLNESSLGLTADELILLKDLRGNVIDSVYYSDKWHNKNFISTKGRSLERINPFLNSNDRYNWNTCVDPKGATPGAKNSIYVINTKTNSSISVNPNPFSPDNDGFEDCTIINYSLKIPLSQVNIKIYDSRGRLVRILSNNMASGPTGSVIFNGLGNDGLALRMGIYIIFLEALNSITGQNEILKTTVVVARKLH